MMTPINIAGAIAAPQQNALALQSRPQPMNALATAQQQQGPAYNALAMNGGPTSAAAAQLDADWLTYSNQNAVRNDPLSPELVEALSFLPEMGITMEVFSGGQAALGTPGEQRVGSTRHDGGNAADVFFYKDGRRLSWENPEDIPMLQEIVRRSRSAGITGVGAGPGYMQPGSMHIGFGNEAVWGADGKGANAPNWLRTAFYG